ncbi:MAG TPA: hypothetical protein VN751_12040 [Solirubrobacteraceae bacterium]|jgi:hypothetical protein|nr:hypothetical protein [Solirubrobacteraceae bacterium]
MCWSRREWREEMERRERDRELRELLDREPTPERPTYVGDPDPEPAEPEREVVLTER